MNSRRKKIQSLSLDHEIDIEFIKKYSYLFIVDIDRINQGEILTKYEEREKGYGKALLSAYNYAFAEEINHKISKELILGIHQKAMAHVPDSCPGEFRKGSGYVPLALPVYENSHVGVCNPNASVEGFWQFTRNWLVNEKEPLHFIHFKSNKSNRNMYVTPIDAHSREGLWFQDMNTGSLFISNYDEKFNQLLKVL